MTRIGTTLTIAAALAIGAMLGGGGLVQANLGTGGEAIGGSPDIASANFPRVGTSRAVGNCITNRTRYRTQDNAVSTTSSNIVVMANTHFPVTHGAGCLIVDFSAEVTATSTNTHILITASIPGLIAAEPPFATIAPPGAASIYQLRSMRFVFPNVPAGTHTVAINWGRTGGDGTLFARNRTLTVQYRP